MVLEMPDVVQAVHQRTPEAVQFPDQEAIGFPCLGIGHQPIQARPVRLAAADDVLVGLHKQPALAFCVGLEIPDLHLGILVNGGNPSIKGGSVGFLLLHFCSVCGSHGANR
jgi:hypothetical protein